MDYLTLAKIIGLLSVSALCIGIIFFLKKISKTVGDLGTRVEELSLQVRPLLASTTNLTEKLNSITEDAKEPITAVKEIVDEVKIRVDKYLEMEERIRSSVEKPVTDFSKNISAALNGVNAFWSTYKRK